MIDLVKYPRTPHLEGSRLQPGDDDLAEVPLASLAGAHVVIEEKVDGANAGLRFDAGGRLWLQSRGHFLTGGGRERHFDLFKRWATARQAALWPVLGARFALYGEWLFAKHTVFYDHLPHYFLEYDVLDLGEGRFLSTTARRRLLAGLPLVSVAVLHAGPAPARLSELRALVGTSRYKSPAWRAALAAAITAAGVDPARAARETDSDDAMEGLYIKAEAGDTLLGRYKWIRPSYLQAVADSGSHWLDRPIVENALAPGADLFAP
jgi:hypothetical protein